MALCVTRLQLTYERTASFVRKKLDASLIEGTSHRAAVVIALAKEFCCSTAVSEASVQKHFVDAWANGSDHIDMEIQALLLEQNPDFDVTKHVPCLKMLLEEHMFTAPLSADSQKAEQIAADEFELTMRQLDYDV